MFKNLARRIKNRKGFTLIELIVVIAILGILAMIAIPRFTGIQERAREQTDIANARSLASVGAAMFSSGQLTPAAGGTDYDAMADDADFATNISNGWPVSRAAAGNGAVLVMNVTADGVVTVTTNGIALYPTPGGAYAN